MQFFYQNGVRNITENKIINQLSLSADDFFTNFKDKEDFIKQAVDFELEEKIRQDAQIQKEAANPVEEIFLLLRHNVMQLTNIHPGYFVQLQYLYPQIWQTYTRHAQMHGYYQVYDLVSAAIKQNFFHRNINIEIVTKVLIEQANIMHNTHLFPGKRYNLGEVFRNIFLYYLKGLCTEKGICLIDKLFADLNFDAD